MNATAIVSRVRLPGREGAGRWLPVGAGLMAAALLLAAYVGVVTWAQGAEHARELLWADRYFVAGVVAGFGTQIGLFVWLRRAAGRARARGAAGLSAAGTGTSSAAMVACCAHHVTDALPLVGLSAAAVFLTEYRSVLMALGLATNAAGVALLLGMAIRERRRLAQGCEAGS